MKSIEIIKNRLQEAEKWNIKDEPFIRDKFYRNAFAALEAERLKVSLWSYNLGGLGDELYIFTDCLADLMYQFTDGEDMDEKQFRQTLSARIEALEYYLIKILAIADILLLDENCKKPVSIYGITERIKTNGETAE